MRKHAKAIRTKDQARAGNGGLSEQALYEAVATRFSGPFPTIPWRSFLDFPDYWTQGETLEDLRDHLRDLYADLSDGHVPGIRRVDDLVIS